MSDPLILSPQEQLTLQILEDLHQEWMPHSGQIKVAKPMVHNNLNTLFVQCGRKWGKTEFAAYMLWRHALLNPGSACYYITPELSHGREIIWSNNRLQTFGNKKYIKTIKNIESRVVFNNGSFIKIVGSENWSAANGLTPDFVVYDEFKVFHPNFHTEMNPNRLAKKAPLIIIGTPPKTGDRNRSQYIKYASECKERKDSLWIRRTSYDNPHIDPAWLDEEKERLFARNDFDIWFREYEAKYVIGGSAAIFPMWDSKRFVQPYNKLMSELKRDLKKLQWFCIADPGSTTCFAVLLGAINPFTKKLYLLDVIYEKDQLNTSVRNIYPAMDNKMMQLYPCSSVNDDWCKIYDEAAAWFSNEVMQQYGVYFMPTAKHINKKDHGISLIKDQMLHDLVVVSDRCGNLIKEVEGYASDDKGNIPKKDDHLIDCWRYLNAAANYSMVEVMETIKQQNDSDRGMRRMEDDMFEHEKESDWTTNVFKWWE